MIRAGVISDTHGLLRPSALAALRGVDLIIHAGDVGSPEILAVLGKIAPVTAVRGNIDGKSWARDLPESATLQVGEQWLYLIHDVDSLELDPRAAGFAAVIAGHSHEPKNEIRNGVLYFNPGSAGPRRFCLPIALGFLTVRGKSLSGEIVILEV